VIARDDARYTFDSDASRTAASTPTTTMRGRVTGLVRGGSAASGSSTPYAAPTSQTLLRPNQPRSPNSTVRPAVASTASPVACHHVQRDRRPSASRTTIATSRIVTSVAFTRSRSVLTVSPEKTVSTTPSAPGAERPVLIVTELGGGYWPKARLTPATSATGTTLAATTGAARRSRASSGVERSAATTTAAPRATARNPVSIRTRVAAAISPRTMRRCRGDASSNSAGARTTIANANAACSRCSIPTNVTWMIPIGRPRATSPPHRANGPRRRNGSSRTICQMIQAPAATLSTNGTHRSGIGRTIRPAAVRTVQAGDDDADSYTPGSTPHVPWNARLSAMARW